MYIFSEASLQHQFRNECFNTVAKGVLEIFGTKVLYFTMPYELTKNKCFLLSFIGGD